MPSSIGYLLLAEGFHHVAPQPAGVVAAVGKRTREDHVRRPRGVAADSSGKAAADARREQDVDLVLEAAGIRPGDPSLYRRADGTFAEPQ